MPTFSGASGALGVTQQFQPGSFQSMIEQQNNDMLVKQKRLKLKDPTDPNSGVDPNALYSSSASYRSLLGLGQSGI